LGISFSYDNTFTGEKTPPNLSAASGSADELKYSMKDMFNIHNQKLTSTGSFDFGKGKYSQELKINQSPTASETFSSIAGGISLLAQYTEGAMQGFKVTQIQLPIWNIGNKNFFSAVKPELNTIINNNGSLTTEYIPHFYSLPEMLSDRSIRNYANYLEMPNGFHKNIRLVWNNWFRGWDY